MTAVTAAAAVFRRRRDGGGSEWWPLVRTVEKMDEDEGGSRWSKWCEVGYWSRSGGGVAMADCVAISGVVVLLQVGGA